MAVPVEEWRLPEKRRISLQKLEEAFSTNLGVLPAGINQSPQDLEQAICDKSKKEEEYNNYVQQVLFRLTRGRVRQGHQQVGGMAQQVGGQIPGNMMNMQQPQAVMNSSAQTYNQGHYQQVTSGMHPSSIPNNDMGMPQPSPHYVHNVYNRGGGMVHQPNQPGYNPIRMQNHQVYPQRMIQTGYNTHNNMTSGGQRYMPTMTGGGVPGMGVRGQMGPEMTQIQHGIRPNNGPVQVPNMGMGVSGSSLHSVLAISNPSYPGPGAVTSQSFSSTAHATGVQLSPRPPISEYVPSQVSTPPSSTANSSVEQTGAGIKGQQNGPGSISGANPPTPHSVPVQGSVPSPAPPTPLHPASPATSGVGSPAHQPTVTPEENEAYMRKLSELQKHIPLLHKWIMMRMNTGDKNSQLTKLVTLHSILTNSNKRVPLNTLMRCGEALDKMFSSSSMNSESNSTPSKSAPITSILSQPHTEPVVPLLNLTEPHHSPSLHEFRMVSSPPSSCESLLETIKAKPLPAERLPPAKRMCNRDEPAISPGLRRELALITNVKVEQLPKESRFDKSTTLHCCLNDDGLSPVPPLRIRIPPDYPLVSPVCDLNEYHNSSNSALVREVGKLLSDQLTRSFHSYSLSSLLSDWETCVLRAMASCLLTSEIN